MAVEPRRDDGLQLNIDSQGLQAVFNNNNGMRLAPQYYHKHLLATDYLTHQDQLGVDSAPKPCAKICGLERKPFLIVLAILTLCFLSGVGIGIGATELRRNLNSQ